MIVNEKNLKDFKKSEAIRVSGAICYRSYPTSSPKKSSTTSKPPLNNSA